MATIPQSLLDLGLIDIRDRLSVKPSNPAGCRRARRGAVTGATLHYNGPRVSAFGKPTAELRHVVENDTPNHQQRIGADSLQYHIVILSDGSRYLTRDLSLQAWHCGSASGNEGHLAIHLPLGGQQDATEEQWESACAVFEAIIIGYRLSGRGVILGHKEWSPTQCPGAPLMARLEAWRNGMPRDGGMFRILSSVAAANVREGPARSFPVALAGKAMLYPGDTVDADAIVVGENIGGDNRWAHLRSGIGFVHMSLVRAR